jgi:hypothetical protein
MKSFATWVIVVFLALGTTVLCAQKPGTLYGAPPSHADKPVRLSYAVETGLVDKPISVMARVAEVCKKKGCWMMITDGRHKARVTFKDYGFFVPRSLRGKRVMMEGVLTMSELSEGDARHYAEDAGKTKKEIARIKGPQKELSFEATSVVVRR